ncbi:CIC11C00000003340 [Sungouiella intermedia]|uniref:CIC11C00000003340 n=1 Tax=Sungouiella intermedia TaxID=45354 RepID=A0A1L0CZR1_9ASCO|nr:CIC11C00000003340 [[Candida] intermedia]
MEMDQKSIQVSILGIDRTLARQVKKVEKLLEMVNRELSAPAANDSWKKIVKTRTKVGNEKNMVSKESSVIEGKAL